MNKREFAPPTPEVQYLPAIFRRIQNGEIRIPAFQRRFVWSEAQIISLLESVYNGFPIGSVLFWKVDGPQLNIAHGKGIPFPDVEVRYPISFVLDGMQRLSSLYGVFHWDKRYEVDNFNIVFDLSTEKFARYDTNMDMSRSIHLSALFSPRLLLDVQKILATQPDGDQLIDKSIQLHSVFQEYLLPTVTISDRAVEDVVKIFQRINSTGTRLGPVDFMRALTWSSKFDLSTVTRQIQVNYSDEGFYIPDETIVKAISVVLGKEPTPTQMLALQSETAEALHSAVDNTERAIMRTIRFLQHEFNIFSYDFVPYEGQLLVLTKLFHKLRNPKENILSIVRRWFWSIGFSEGLRGRPESYVINYLNAIDRLVEGDLKALNYRLSLDKSDLIERRFTVNKALSSTVTSAFAVNKVRSLVSGEVINPQFFMRTFSSENFAHLFSRNKVCEILNKDVPSPRTFANMIVVEESDISMLTNLHQVQRDFPASLIDVILQRFGKDAYTIFESQMISHTAVEALLSNDPARFFEERSKTMYDFAVSLSSGNINNS